MNASLDWGRIVADLDAVRFRRGMTWVAMADLAGVEDYSVWRLKREGTISANALLPLMAWAGLNELGRYIKDSPDYRVAAEYERGRRYGWLLEQHPAGADEQGQHDEHDAQH